MKELTISEYRTILELLTGPTSSVRDQIRESGLPSSTFNLVRRRAFEEGWVEEALVPDPGPAGFSCVEIASARPTLDQRDALIGSWGADPACTVLWVGMHAVFAVHFREGTSEARSASASDHPEMASFRVRVDRDSGAIPVYFDYGGLWARFGGQPRPPAYPRGLDLASPPASRRALAEARSTMGAAPGNETPSRWNRFFGRPSAQSPTIAEGVLRRRTLLDPAAVPAYEGRRIGELILLRGHLRPDVTILGFLNALTGECGVYPFLLAESEGGLILGGLGQVSARAYGRVPVPSARVPVMKLVTSYVDSAELMLEPVEAITTVVQHRYTVPLRGVERPAVADRTSNPPASGSSSRP